MNSARDPFNTMCDGSLLAAGHGARGLLDGSVSVRSDRLTASSERGLAGMGLPRQLALTLVAQTVLGAARMVLATGRHPASLRDDVTTPAGCTIAGLLMLEDGRIRSVLARAVEEATKISAHLGAAPTKFSETPASQRTGH